MPLMKALNHFKTLPLALCIASSSLLSINLSHAATPTEYVNYQKIQLEERAWAGLQTKSIRIGDIVWS